MWIVIAAAAAACLIVERVRPARPLPAVAGWWPRALLLNGLQLGVILLAGVAWDGWLQRASLLDWGARFSPLVGGLLGYLVTTFIYYWWHRARHASDWLWRLCHQLHHSPTRLETITSFYKHPIELLANSALSSAISYTLLGLSLEGAAVVTMISAVAEFFYHVNARTPRWVGWIVQRPEMHRIHHERGVHRCNYGDLPIWDLLFGTLENPVDREVECGFVAHREQALGAMLLARDVNAEVSHGA